MTFVEFVGADAEIAQSLDRHCLIPPNPSVRVSRIAKENLPLKCSTMAAARRGQERAILLAASCVGSSWRARSRPAREHGGSRHDVLALLEREVLGHGTNIAQPSLQ
jgi:hypothetical protein